MIDPSNGRHLGLGAGSREALVICLGSMESGCGFEMEIPTGDRK